MQNSNSTKWLKENRTFFFFFFFCLTYNETMKVISFLSFFFFNQFLIQFYEKPFLCNTLDDVMTRILFKFLYCSFYDNKKKRKKKRILKMFLKSQHIVFLFLQNAYKCSCSPKTCVVEVAPEHLYTSRIMTIPTIWLGAQPRLRSVWASAQSDAQSDQSLRCAFNG